MCLKINENKTKVMLNRICIKNLYQRTKIKEVENYMYLGQRKKTR